MPKIDYVIIERPLIDVYPFYWVKVREKLLKRHDFKSTVLEKHQIQLLTFKTRRYLQPVSSDNVIGKLF